MHLSRLVIIFTLGFTFTISGVAQSNEENTWNPFGGAGMGGPGPEGSENGPGIGSGMASGSDRKVVKEPEIDNPTEEEGRVMLDLIIDQEGDVISVKVLSTHRLTTTDNPILFKAAEKAAWDWKFSKDPNGPEKQRLYKAITFTIDQ